MRVLRIIVTIILLLPGTLKPAFSQKVRLTLWNYYLEKFYISDQLTPVDGFCFKASKSIHHTSGNQQSIEEEVNMVHLILFDASSNKKYLCMGGYDEEIKLYNIRIRPENTVSILETDKNYFSPNICKIKDAEGRSGILKFSRDRLLIFDESEELIGEYQGSLVPNDEISLFLYDRLNDPEKERIY